MKRGTGYKAAKMEKRKDIILKKTEISWVIFRI